MKHFFAAFTLLTVMPVPARWSPATNALGKSLAWFPLVGACLGILLALALYFLQTLYSDWIASALVLALWAFLTGAMHLEGTADAGDGLLSTAPREKRLEIMRDPRVGAFGVVAVTLLLIAKFAALASLRDGIYLVLSPILARWAMVLVALFPLARTDGMAVRFHEGLTRREVFIATVLAAIGAGAFGWRGVAAWIAATLVVIVIVRVAQSRLGGVTGDVLGAIGEVAEVVVLVVGQ